MFTVPKKDLVRALDRVASVASKKSINPILKCARLTVSDGELTTYATDLFTAITTRLPVAKAKACDIAIDATMLLQRVKSLEEGDVIVEVSGKSVAVRTGRARRFTIPFAPGEDYPAVTAPKDPTTLAAVEGAHLARLIEGVRHATCRDDARAAIAGILLRVAKGAITAVATDGHRMAIRKLSTPTAAEADLLIPNAAVNELARVAEGDGTVTIAISGHTLIAAREMTSVTLKTTDAQYPPYENILNALSSRFRVTTNRARLLDGVKAVSVAAEQVNRRVVIDVDADRIKLVSSSQQAGEFVDEVSASVEGDPLRIGFDARYVTEALSAISDEEVTLQYNGELEPVVIRTADSTLVLMPQVV